MGLQPEDFDSMIFEILRPIILSFEGFQKLKGFHLSHNFTVLKEPLPINAPSGEKKPLN